MGENWYSGIFEVAANFIIQNGGSNMADQNASIRSIRMETSARGLSTSLITSVHVKFLN